MTALVLPPVRRVFRSLAATILPEASQLDAGAWTEVERIIEDALAARPPAVQRHLRRLIRVLQLLPIVRYGRPFTELDPARRTRFLAAVQNSSVPLLRRGFWGLRTLVFMGYYARSMAGAEIGYRAHAGGWGARR